MRKFFTSLCLALLGFSVLAQIPQGINYQAVARNATGQVLATQNISVKISIIDGSATGTVQYSETHSVATNQFGLFNIVIGNGVLFSGSFAGITWSTGNKFIKVEVDPSGGSAFIDMGTTKLQSVPFALASPLPPPSPSDLNGDQNYIVINDGSNKGVNSDIWDSAGMVGIGTTAPKANLHVLNNTGNAIIRIESPGGSYESRLELKKFGTLGNSSIGFFPGNADLRLRNSNPNAAITFEIDTIEKMRINPNGNVGIGTSNPASVLHIVTDQTVNVFKIHNPNLGTGSLVGMEFGRTNSLNNMAEFRFNYVGPNSSQNFINLGLWNNTNSLIIQGSGNVGIGTTSPGVRLDVVASAVSNSVCTIRNTGNNSTTWNDGMHIFAGSNTWQSAGYSAYIGFHKPDGTWIGGIQQASATSITYGTTSDIRLKSNIHDTKYGLDELLKIQVSDYYYNDDTNTEQTGFIAQQLIKYYPAAVIPGDEDPKIRPFMVDYGKLTPLLVKSVQQQQKQIANQNIQISQLQAQVEELKKSIELLRAQSK